MLPRKGAADARYTSRGLHRTKRRAGCSAIIRCKEESVREEKGGRDEDSNLRRLLPRGDGGEQGHWRVIPGRGGTNSDPKEDRWVQAGKGDTDLLHWAGMALVG